MDNLLKIRELTIKYDISARALRYYEDMGLITSTRSEDYAYRLYDEAAIKRLEQILILRKLNIGIKDIKLIFDSDNSSTILEILDKKTVNIDDEIALLHELKIIVLDFIKQIKELDFNSSTDIKQLFNKAKEIEIQLNNVDYDGNPSSINKLVDISSKLEKMPDIRVMYFPVVKMARSGSSDLDAFNAWWSAIDIKHYIFPRDFMWRNEKLDCFEWLFAIPEGMTDTAGYEVFDFPGGLYAVATAIDGDDILRVNRLIHKWVDDSGCFVGSNKENDINERYDMGTIITPDIFKERMGYHLMDLFIPIVVKN